MEGESIAISSSTSSEKSVRSISILVVDDDIACLSIAAAMLKKFKYEVVTAKHPKDALCTLRIKDGTFDLVVSDVHMPDMDGFELQKVIVKEFNIPVVLMSADDRDDIVSKGFDNGAAYFISKPVSEEDLRGIWQFATKNKKCRITVKEMERLLEPKINLDEIIVPDSSDDEDINEKKDSEKKIPKKTVSDENTREISGSSSQKKPKLVWTDSLHNRFLEAIRKLGLHKAVPKKILEVMDLPGLTRENVASHLQKYRIFLRRVIDSSYEIQYGSDEGSTRSFGSRLTSLGSSCSSVSILNDFTKNYYRNLGRFQYCTSPFRNLSPSSGNLLTGSGLARLVSNKGNLFRPKPTTPNLLIHNADHSDVRFGQDIRNQTIPSPLETLSKYGLTASFNASSSKEIIGTSPNIISVEQSKIFRTNYVGYMMSDLKHPTESRFSKKNQDLQSGSGIKDLPPAEFQGNNLYPEATFPYEHTNIDYILDQFVANSTDTLNNNGGKHLSDVISDYQMLITNSNRPLPNGDGIGEAYTPLFDLDEFHIASTEQLLHVGTELCHTTLADQTSFENLQEQAQEVHQPHVSQEIDTLSQFGKTHHNLDQVEDQEFLESLLSSFL